MGGKSSTTQQTVDNEPPDWAKPALQLGGQQLIDLFKSGSGFNTYRGPWVAGQSNWTTGAQKDIAGSANMLNQSGIAALKAANQNIASGGLTDPNRRSINMLQGIANGSQSGVDRRAIRTLEGIAGGGGMDDLNKASQVTRGLINQADNKGAAATYLTDTAQGKYLEGSPFFDDLLAKQTAKIGDQVNSTMSGMGRYGSGAHQGTLADSIGDFRLSALNDNYARERGLMVDAAGTIENAQQNRLGIGLSGANQLAGIGNTIVGNRMGAATGAAGLNNNMLGTQASAALGASGISDAGANRALQYSGMLPQLQSGANAGNMLKLQMGGMDDAYRQRVIDAARQKFGQQDMSDWQRLSALLSGGVTAAGPWGTQNSTTTTSQPFNPMAMIGMLSNFLPVM